MKKVFFMLFVTSIAIGQIHSVATQSIPVNGVFGKYLMKKLFYFESHDEVGEEENFTLKVLDFELNTKIDIDDSLYYPMIDCQSDSTVIYAKKTELISYNTVNKKKEVIFKTLDGLELIGFKLSPANMKEVLLMQVNYRTEIISISIFNFEMHKELFDKKVAFHNSEGISPQIYFLNSSYIFTVEDDIYKLSFTGKFVFEKIAKGEFSVSDSCYIYSYFSDGIKGQISQTNCCKNNEIKQIEMPQKYLPSKCNNMHLTTSTEYGKFISYFNFCNVPYFQRKGKWVQSEGLTIFEDDKIKVQYFINKSKIVENSFVYNLK